jgi:hypothetical protein
LRRRARSPRISHYTSFDKGREEWRKKRGKVMEGRGNGREMESKGSVDKQVLCGQNEKKKKKRTTKRAEGAYLGTGFAVGHVLQN